MLNNKQLNYYALFFPLILFSVSSVFAAAPPTQRTITGTWQPVETAFARVHASRQTRISLPFAVRITALSIEPGTTVKQGDELVRFDAPAIHQHLSSWYLARQEQALTQKRLQLLHKNEKEHTITRRELTLGEQTVAAARIKTRLAWETLAADLLKLNITSNEKKLARQIKTSHLHSVAAKLGRLQAPFDGVVVSRQSSLGEQLPAGATILELEALDSVYVDVGISENVLSTWQKGKTLWPNHSDEIPLRPVEGMPLYDPASGLWLLRFIANNPGYLLREGNWIKVKHLGVPQPVVWLPAAAVVTREGKTWAVIQKAATYHAVEIKVGPTTKDGRVPVLKGIQPGETVVTEGAYELLYRDIKDLIKFVD